MFFLSLIRKHLLARMLQARNGKAASREERKKGGDATTVREQRGLTTGPPQSVRRSHKMPDVALAAPSWLAARSFFARGPTRRLSRRGHNKGNNRRCSGAKQMHRKQMHRGDRKSVV